MLYGKCEVIWVSGMVVITIIANLYINIQEIYCTTMASGLLHHQCNCYDDNEEEENPDHS